MFLIKIKLYNIVIQSKANYLVHGLQLFIKKFFERPLKEQVPES